MPALPKKRTQKHMGLVSESLNDLLLIAGGGTQSTVVSGLDHRPEANERHVLAGVVYCELPVRRANCGICELFPGGAENLWKKRVCVRSRRGRGARATFNS